MKMSEQILREDGDPTPIPGTLKTKRRPIMGAVIALRSLIYAFEDYYL